MIPFIFMVISFIFLAFIFNKLISSDKTKPPGPWGVPILGHLPLLGQSPHRKLLQWKKIYGPIISVQFGSFPSVVLNDLKLIKEAFHMASTAGRPALGPYAKGTEGKGIIFVDGSDVMEQRQFLFKSLKILEQGKEANISDQISQLLDTLGQRSGQWVNINNLFDPYIINGLFTIVNSETYDNDDPQLKRLIHCVTEGVSRSDSFIEKLSLFLPFLGTLMPSLSGYNSKIAAFKEVYAYMRKTIDEKKLTWVKGQPRDLTDLYFDKIEDTTDPSSIFHKTREIQERTTAEVFGATIDTTSKTLEYFISHMARNPQVVKKLQKEMDTFIGSRPPCVNDRQFCPYADAVVLELFRITSIAPFSIFHRALSDISLEGYKIKKDTMIVGNLFAVHHDKDVWGDPEIFRPERFLNDQGQKQNLENLIPFSVGRRVCPGEKLARDHIFLYVTGITQRFNILLKPGTKEPREKFGLALAPSQFQVSFTEREREI